MKYKGFLGGISKRLEFCHQKGEFGLQSVIQCTRLVSEFSFPPVHSFLKWLEKMDPRKSSLDF